MKKIIALALVLVLAFSCVACGNTGSKNVKVVDIALSEESYAFAIAKDNAELLTKTNEYLAKIVADGTFDAICEKYFTHYGE